MTFPYPLQSLSHPSPSKKKKMASRMYSAVVEPTFSKNILFWNWSCLGINQRVLSRLEPLDWELANKKSWPEPQQQPVLIMFSKLELVGQQKKNPDLLGSSRNIKNWQTLIFPYVAQFFDFGPNCHQRSDCVLSKAEAIFWKTHLWLRLSQNKRVKELYQKVSLYVRWFH